jgi:acetyl coenzyme A synthetase (ADP forming)-like protein
MNQLDYFFDPKTVAVIGASHEKNKLGYIVFTNFLGNISERKVFPVNPDTTPILGQKVYKSILQISDKVDLAVIIVPAKIVPKVLEECVKKGVKAVVIVSGGFSETGEEGKKLEIKLKHIIENSNTRVMGPNCLGVFDPYTNVDTLFLSRKRLGRPSIGNIGYISQSGSVGSTVLDWLAKEQTGISKFISYENGMDLNECDFIEYLGNDSRTKVITVFLEGVIDGKRFLEVAKKTNRKKPIVILKGGKTETGSKAVASHTGSLAGSAKIYSSVFKQMGLIEANNWEELFDFAKAFSTQPIPKGDKIAIVTDGGGFGVLAVDECEIHNLQTPEPSDKLKRKIRGSVPKYGSLKNPIDLTGVATANRYKVVLEECLKSGEYDGVIAIVLFQVPMLKLEITDILADLKKYKKPIICCSAGGDFTIKLSRILERKGIPVYQTPRRAVSAMSSLVKYWKYIQSK